MTPLDRLLPSVDELSRLSVRADGGSGFILWDFRCEWQRGAALTYFFVHAIITAGRDDASDRLLPSVDELSRLSVRADGGSGFILWDFRVNGSGAQP